MSAVELPNCTIPRCTIMEPNRLMVIAKPAIMANNAKHILHPVNRFGFEFGPSQQRQRKNMRKNINVSMSQNPGMATNIPNDSKYSLSFGSNVMLAGSGRNFMSTCGFKSSQTNLQLSEMSEKIKY
ncbi:hypothetical protein DERF_008885 [Dermatophagoides farinae]|uniref:Uncharacterized protein n=1 Tax=Dermatophagoides farinae TaxID=6954 RepID=A0A922I3B0_DERFA|nr:hypothetical protein DERF_008885 [Dermatophagoides farinae]